MGKEKKNFDVTINLSYVDYDNIKTGEIINTGNAKVGINLEKTNISLNYQQKNYLLNPTRNTKSGWLSIGLNL